MKSLLEVSNGVKKLSLLVLVAGPLVLGGCKVKPLDNTTSPPSPTNQQGPGLDQAPQSSSVSQVLDAVAQDTGIAFGQQESTSFFWYTEEGDEQEVEGTMIEVDKLSDEEVAAVDEFFNAFEVSMANVADGTVVGAVGYEVDDQVVCKVTKGLSEEALEEVEEMGEFDPLEFEDATTDVTIECGELDILLR